MTSDRPDLLLDVSRTVSRMGAGGTSGVDRVERAYIRHALSLDRRVFFVSRVLRGVALIEPEGMRRILRMADAPETLPAPDLLGHAARKQSPALRRAQTAVRRHCAAWCRSPRTADLLGSRLRKGFVYVNTGQTHLEAPFLDDLKAAGCGTRAVMIHDVIPLDHPEYMRPWTEARFAGLMGRVGAAAELVIYNSADTRARAERWFARNGRTPPGVAALLGVDPLPPRPAAPAPEGPPHFVMLGTIEPRKNHLMMLSVWRRFHDTLPQEDIPHLHVVGRRGWENENIVDLLERAPYMGRSVFEHGFLDDAEVAGLLASARALLFPSFAEGFGYPLAEALQMGVPAICSDLAVFRELAGDVPCYLDPLDGPGWAREILSRAAAPGAETVAIPALPDWQSHFDLVFSKL